MIYGTQSDCKIKKISISESTATITLLVFASKDTAVPKPFWICIRDKDSTEKIRVDSKTYWIDKINNYNSDTNNVNINKYKEIIIDVDITNNNTSKIADNHWVRECYIVLVDSESSIQKPLWSSDKLDLISEQFEIPEVKSISFFTSNLEDSVEYDGVLANINVRVSLEYNKTKKVAYNNRNIHATLIIRSIATKRVLESKDFSLSEEKENILITDNKYQFGEPVQVSVELRNVYNEVFNKINKIYRPYKKWSYSYIKTNQGVKKVKAFYVNCEVGTSEDENRQHEGDWL